ncbi:MAG: hypothetical protein K0S44_2449 [Bacteroidetes bacterium]|jgi:uncharacterized repeat protein (TIGR01451 family)|nr:hypothetical protein [Bacteroidota bacterium]
MAVALHLQGFFYYLYTSVKKTATISLLVLALTSSFSQTFDWVKKIGGKSFDYASDIKRDINGIIYAIGTFQDSCDMDPGPGTFFLHPANPYDITMFISKMDAEGNLIWAKNLGGTVGPRSVGTDASGNIYVSGCYYGTVDLDPDSQTMLTFTSNGSNDIFIMKLDATGNLLWVKTMGGLYSTENYSSMVTDSFGNTYSTGFFADTVDFDPGPGIFNLSTTSGVHLFVQKLDSNGNLLWVKQIGGGYETIGSAINLSQSNNIFITGHFGSTVDFDPSPASVTLTSLGDVDVFVLKLDSSGNFKWAKSIGGVNYDQGISIITDNSENVYTSGCFIGTVDFDPGIAVQNLVTNGNTYNAFLLKLDSSGDFKFAKKIAMEGSSYGTDMVVGGNGSIYLAGNFQNSVDLDPGMGFHEIISRGQADVFISKYDSLGNYLWGKQTGGDYDDEIFSLIIDPTETLYAYGSFSNTAYFDDNMAASLTSVEPWKLDIFLLKMSADSCMDLLVSIDSATNANCTSLGFAAASAINGQPPYSFMWDTNPVTNNSSAIISNNGIYSITVTDGNSCSKTSSVLINAPDPTSSYDLSSHLVSTTYRVGFLADVWLDTYNKSCIPTSGSVRLILDSLLIYNSSIPVPDLISGDTLTWNFTNLSYDSAHITPHIFLKTPVWASINDSINLKVQISPIATDTNPNDNVTVYSYPVINGYDPNKKDVNPKGLCSPGYIQNNQLLTYTVNFQNTGNAEAINIYVTDTLDTDLNINTVRVIGSSHPLITEVSDNVLLFRFDNINLLDSLTNEPNSHGYVIFEVMPLPGLTNGTNITNDVGIYFDFNPPVYTNTVLNTISDGTLDLSTSYNGNEITASLSGAAYQWFDCSNNINIADAQDQSYIPSAPGNYAVIISDGCFSDTSACVIVVSTDVTEENNGNSFSFYPNPSDNTITFSSKETIQIRIINMLGEVIIQTLITDDSTIDLSELSKGIYFIQNEKGGSRKFIKQ